MEETVDAMKENRYLPAEEETLPIPASVGISSLHVQTEGEGVNVSAVVEPLSPNLFRVMRIVPDMQDYSFVEKVQLPQDEVLSLCNKLVPSSASVYVGEPPQVRINFNLLDLKCLPTAGFYGDKSMIISAFRKESLVDDYVLAKMERGLFESGLYVSLPDKARSVVLFYWHEGEHFKQASRKDVSCNFIRYLVELCDTVYVCVQGSYSFEALATAAAKPSSKDERTINIQVTKVKSSANDVELSPGYIVRIDVGAKNKKSSLEPTANAAVLNNNDETVVFCEGYHRCCFLIAEKRAPRTTTKVEEVSVKASGLGNMLQIWSSASNVDYSRLSNEQFVDVLKNCQPQNFESYSKFKESFLNRASSINTAQIDEFERFFLQVLSEFCSHVLLFVDDQAGTTKDKDRYADIEKTKELNSLSGKFEELYREVSIILTGENSVSDGDQRVLLVGSDIKFIGKDWEHIITIESSGQAKQTMPFICYGQEVNAKCSRQCSCSRKINGKVMFLQPIDGIKGFPLSGEKVKFVLFTPPKSGNIGKMEVEGTVHLVDKTSSASAIRSWVENMVPIELRSLDRNILFASFMLGSHQPVALAFIQNHLATQKTENLPSEIQDLFEQFCNVSPAQSTVDLEALLSHDTVKTVCDQVYKDQERKFRENIKELSGLVFKKKAEASLGKAEQKRFRKAEEEFLQEKKKMMSTVKNDNLVTRYIEEVTTKRQWPPFSWLWSSTPQQPDLKVKVSIVEEHPFALVYKVCELTPMRKDISDLSSNRERPIVPTCGASIDLAAIDPQNEKLFKVVALKSGELIVFIHSFDDSAMNLYRCPKIGFNINKMSRPIYTFRRGFDLLAVDEGTRSMALYEKDMSKIVIYRFDESFGNVHGTGVEVNLESYEGSKTIVWIHSIPGKMELLLVDDSNRVRVVEIHEKPTMRAKYISLPSQHNSFKATVSVDGYFLLVFRKLQKPGKDIDTTGASSEMILEIYVLGDTMSHLKTIPLSLSAQEYSICDLEKLGAKITSFGSQRQLLLYSPVDAPGIIFSNVLKTVLAAEVVQLQQVDQSKAPEDQTEIALSCPYLVYIYHIFDKFATTPTLFPEAKKRIAFKVVLEQSISDGGNVACVRYLKALIGKLKAGKDKDFSRMEIQFEVNDAENYQISASPEQQRQVKMGMWVRKLLCLVPIQIARAENNAMAALRDGLQLPPSVRYMDSVSLANSIRFGFYDAVLSSWKGKIKVISSMGKQSSGKSYLLNHLSGSLLDVAGGRCTDGVWMTMVTGEDEDDSGESRCLYVLLDFEGLGSFERSEQEDMLLSVLNAAVSNITIFNKKDFHLDKDTESTFSRFQSGINLLKPDKKLFKGLFYIAIKDVDTSDVEDLIQEFYEKISQICRKSQENFILKMYGGKVEIAAMAPYNRSEYYKESLRELAETVEERVDFCYDYGFTFLRDLKLIIAQIVTKDSASTDSKRVAATVDILRRNLIPAVHMGCLSVKSENEKLQKLENFDTQEEVPDFPVVVRDKTLNIEDSGLCLSPSTELPTPDTIRQVLSQIKSEVEMVFSRCGTNEDEWHSLFQNFLEALADRRHDRVQQWISSNTIDVSDNDEMQKLKLEANVALSKIRQGLSLCTCKCSVCFWKCVMEKGHDNQHDCMGSHSCTENCSYCAREENSLNLCGDLAGHEGDHDCKKKNHNTCGDRCYFYKMSSNCNELCLQKPGHSGKHKCNTPGHICNRRCCLPRCSNPCALLVESNHIIHRCHERHCESTSTTTGWNMTCGCNMTCGIKNHFHDFVFKCKSFRSE
ncbi:uncharacterized protein LOC131038027 [Cryptomeria japonica]|uniref:uncharacterized protein LOC131038027 n=1 Tax=Cryptomeria japonica TaxID=3369 RepID=UPI0027D9E763|nr:uncharacterized protein LOC131038027 [Cryptomeria japonica]